MKSHYSKSLPAGGALGIAVGGITVFIIIAVGIVVLRRRANSGPSTGFVEIDQAAASPEEKHVANMQINGYENPTYRYFEDSTCKAWRHWVTVGHNAAHFVGLQWPITNHNFSVYDASKSWQPPLGL